MINRRELIGSSAALAVALPSVSVAKTVDVDNHPLMLNTIAYCDVAFDNRTPGACKQATLMMTRALLERHGDELYPDPSLYMRGPPQWYGMHKLKGAKYTFEFAYDGLPPGFNKYVDYQEWVLDYMIDERIKPALSNFQANKKIRTYIPLLTDRVLIDPMTIEPFLQFMTVGEVI
jgi:hypothetical protein